MKPGAPQRVQPTAQWTWPDPPEKITTVAAPLPATGDFIAYLLRNPDRTGTAPTLEGAERAILADDTQAHMNPPLPPLRPLHPDDALSRAKLDKLARLSTERLVRSLRTGQEHSLKARPDGTILDGHHRIFVLRSRGVDVDALPREVLQRKRIS